MVLRTESVVRAALGVFLVLAGASAVLAGSDPLDLKQGPVIRLDERSWDFGEMRQHTTSEHAFRFRNDGNQTLRILDIDTDCGCTAGVAGDTVLAPGAESKIHVSFQSRAAEGKVQKVVVIKTNDPGEPRIDIVISANITPWIKIGERTLEFGNVHRGETPAVSTVLRGDDGVVWSIKKIQGCEELVDWKITPDGAGAWRVEARLKPDAPMGKFHSRAVLTLDHPNLQDERLFIRGLIYSYFIVEDGQINFASLARGKERTKSLAIHCDGSRAYEITSATSTNPLVKPVLVKKPDGYELQVTLTAPNTQQRVAEDVVLKTTDPTTPEIHVAIRAVIL